MKKKFLAVLLAGAMTVSMLGGCDGPTGNNDKDGGGTGTAGGNTTADADGGGVGSETQAAGSIDSGTAGNPGTSTAGVNSEKSDETLTIVLGDEPASLLVEGTAGSNSTTIRMLLGDRLLDYDDEKGEFTGALLETWEIVDENHLRGHVRKGMTAYDGSEFNAYDILFTLEKSAQLAPNFLTSSLVVENCKVEDDYTILFETSGTVVSTMGMMATGVNSMLDESSLEACGGEDGARTNPCWGVGKYKFVEWVPGQHVLLERNDDYWDDSYNAYYKNIKFTFVSDSATRVMSILSGTADMAPDVPLGTVAGYMDNPDCDVIVLENGNANGIQLNCSRSGPLSDVKVREAIRYAIDTDALNMVASAGQAHREDFYILASSGYYYDPTGGKGITADPQKAKELLAEAGYSDGFEIDILGGASDEEILTAIQSMLSAVGITANINMPDRSVMVPMSESGEYDIFYGGHPAALKFRSLETFKQIEPNSAGAGKYMGGPKITDPVLQELIDKATKELDDKAAAESIKEIVQYIYDSACYIGVHGGIMTSVAAKGLTGIAMDAGACIDLSGIHPAS